MKLNLTHVTCAVLPILVLFGVAPCAASAVENKDALKGITGVYVLIETLPNDATSAGLTKDTLRTDVELRLRRSGVKVLTKEESLDTLGMPYLYCNVNVKCDDSGLCATNIDISINEMVRLVHDPNMTTVATVWHSGSTGTIGRNRIRQLREAVADEVDRFLNDYLAAKSLPPTPIPSDPLEKLAFEGGKNFTLTPVSHDAITVNSLNGRGWRALSWHDKIIYLIGFFNGSFSGSKGATMGEISKAIDSFYDDPRNDVALVISVIDWAEDKILGVVPAELEKEAANARAFGAELAAQKGSSK